MGRVRSNRCFYLPPPPDRGCGKPAVRGRKIKLNDPRTLPAAEAGEEAQLAAGGCIAVSRWGGQTRRFKWAVFL